MNSCQRPVMTCLTISVLVLWLCQNKYIWILNLESWIEEQYTDKLFFYSCVHFSTWLMIKMNIHPTCYIWHTSAWQMINTLSKCTKVLWFVNVNKCNFKPSAIDMRCHCHMFSGTFQLLLLKYLLSVCDFVCHILQMHIVPKMGRWFSLYFYYFRLQPV